MARIPVILLLLAHAGSCAAQCGDGWVRTGGSPDAYDRAQAVVNDNAGNSYIAGQFNGTATFEDTTVTSNGSEDMFFAKYDPDGDLLWLRTMGALGTDNATDLTINWDGILFLSGSHSATCSIGPFVLPNTSGLQQGFVAAFNGDGDVQWVTPITGTGTVLCTGVSWRDAGYPVFVGGSFSDTLTTGGPLASAGGTDAFVTALGPGGSIEWSRRLGGPGNDAATSVSKSAYLDIWLCGYFRDSLVANGITHHSNGGADGFVVMFSPNGTMNFNFLQAGGPLEDAFTHITAWTSHTEFAALQFSGAATISNGPDVTSQGDKDACLLQLVGFNVTNVLQVAGAGTDIIRSIAWGPGPLVITGTVQGDVTVGDLALPGPEEDHCFYAFPSWLSFDVWSAGIAGGQMGDGGLDVAVNNDGEVTIVGKVSGDVLFEGNPVSVDTQGGDMFAWRLCGLANAVPEAEHSAAMRVFPQPAAAGSPLWFADAGDLDPTRWQLRSMEGRLIQSGRVDATNRSLTVPTIPAGLYVLELVDRNDRRITKPIVIAD